MSLAEVSKITCGSFDLDYSKKTLIMGILNVTPDSFSDGGKYNRVDAALKHAEQMVNDGADILDVGGESTRPNYERISDEEEIERVAPIIEAISRNIEIPISVDTYKSRVAEEAVKAGAHILNDIWGGKADSLMAKVAAEYKVPIILMHNRDNMGYGHFVRDVLQDLFESIMLVKDAGVKDENIILDPGIGFAKDLKLNLEMMRNLDKLVSLGYPVLLATSRKSMIGHVLDLPPSERMEGTAATICHGIQQGCQMVRVHDVKEMARTAKMMDVLLGKGE
ncbi:dihydropteroate synthase [Peribacillus simplex]|uniref:Dihydropteroate synthase n=1 Tax=Peribacillus simplex TaxID=1478 RepID=A0AAW7IGU2_9BACI|nr:MULTISPECIES: dihydropteroate synthase [Peribacillus]SNT47818.1 Dihydropteroate synthase [Bacillus sp. OK838]MDM5292167.1 dihydropteroate synthase [Peribacillus simplex]MDM5451097.1 dihydropteroate synthase [Peribacillus simplex]MDV7767001.1 dihydropteroate synthase [Peribacillus sp. CSMR9]MDW7616501.1 dihydropteroate synthase [Peribacillus simplex]